MAVERDPLETDYDHDYWSLGQRMQELAGLLSVEHLLSSGCGFQTILSGVCDRIRKAVDAEAYCLTLLNPHTNHLEMQWQTLGVPEHQVPMYRTPLDVDCNAVRVYLTGEPALVKDMRTDPRVQRRFAALPGLHNMLTVPLNINGRRLGVLNVVNRCQGEFTDADVRRVETLSSLLAVLLENRRLVDELTASERTKTMLHDTAVELGAMFDLGRVANTIAARARALVRSRGAAVLCQTMPATFQTIGRTPECPRVEILHLAATSALAAGRAAAGNGWIAVPMFTGTYLEGVLVTWQRQSGTDPQVVLAAVSSLAPVAALALRNARLFGQEEETARALRASLQGVCSQNQLISQVFEAHRRIDRAVADATGIEGICQTLSDLLQRPVALYDAFFNFTAAGLRANDVHPVTPAQLPSRVRAALLARWDDDPMAIAPLTTPGCPELPGFGVSAPVRSGNAFLGCLCVWGPQVWTGVEQLAIGQAAQAVAVELMHRRTLYEIRQRTCDDLVSELLADAAAPGQRLSQRAALLGCDLHRPYRLMVIRPGLREEQNSGAKVGHQGGRSVAEWRVREAVEARFPGSLVSRQGDDIAVLLALPADEAHGNVTCVQTGQEIVTDLRHHGVAAVVGIGSCCGEPSDYPYAYHEALLVAEILCRGAGGAACIEQFGATHLLLSRVQDNGKLWRFAASALAPVIAYDRIRSADLLRSLEVYLDNECQLTTTASALYVHLNTLRYRLRKIEKMGVDLKDPQSRFAIRLAIQLYRLGAVANHVHVRPAGRRNSEA